MTTMTKMGFALLALLAPGACGEEYQLDLEQATAVRNADDTIAVQATVECILFGVDSCDPETICVSAVAFGGAAEGAPADLDAGTGAALGSASACVSEVLQGGDIVSFALTTDHPVTVSPAHLDISLTTTARPHGNPGGGRNTQTIPAP